MITTMLVLLYLVVNALAYLFSKHVLHMTGDRPLFVGIAVATLLALVMHGYFGL